MDMKELVELIPRLVVEKRASDLHLMSTSKPVLRIDGDLVVQENLPLLTGTEIELILEQIANQEQKAIFDKDHELDFTYSIPGLARFRVNALQQRGTTSLAFRLVPYRLPTIDELELPQICKELIMKTRGLILVTGAAGTGKSTTLAAMINHLNQNARRNVLTVEDPIEFTFRNNKCIIRQRNIGDDTRSFATALVHALRHDPDVLVIGEMRDLDTVSTAIRAAETGHLVLSTLHTIDAAQSIDRMVDVFPYGQQRQIRLQLSQVVVAVLSQRLLYRRTGGRIAAFEIMLNNSIISRLIREEKIHEITANIELYFREGMQTIDQALANLVKRDLVDQEEAFAKCADPVKLQKFLQGTR